MSSKNYSQTGVSDTLELGKNGNVIVSDSTNDVVILTTDGSALCRGRGADAIGPTDFVTYQQLQSASAGITWKDPVFRASSRSGPAITATWTDAQLNNTFDGSTPFTSLNPAGKRVLVNDQTPATENGIYLISGTTDAWTFTRTADAAVGITASGTGTISTDNTSDYPDQLWVCTTDGAGGNPALFGDAINFGRYGSLGPGVSSITPSTGGIALVDQTTGDVTISDLIAGSDISITGGSGSAITIGVTPGAFVTSVTNTVSGEPSAVNLVNGGPSGAVTITQLMPLAGVTFDTVTFPGAIGVNSLLQEAPHASYVGAISTIATNGDNEASTFYSLYSADGSVTITPLGNKNDGVIDFSVNFPAAGNIVAGQGVTVQTDTPTPGDTTVSTANPEYSGTFLPGVPLIAYGTFNFTGNGTNNYGTLPTNSRIIGISVLVASASATAADLNLSVGANVVMGSTEIDGTVTGSGNTFVSTKFQAQAGLISLDMSNFATAGSDICKGEFAITYFIGSPPF